MTDEIKAIIKSIKKNYDEVSTLDDDESSCVVAEWVSTGCLVLDYIMGEGLPVGRVVEIYGEPSSGKSLIAAQVAACAQEDGASVVYADTETAVSLPMMEEIGVDVSKLIYVSPDTMEDVFRIFEDAILAKREDNFLLLIWDSIAGTSIRMEMEKDYGDATMGTHARIMSQGLRKLTRLISKHRCAMLLINQTRQKIGVMFGDKVATFGGKAVPFHSSIRLYLEVGKKIKSGKTVVGVEMNAEVKKNKVAMPFKTARLPVYFGHGIDDDLATLYFLRDNSLISSSGGWYKWETKDGKELKFQTFGWRKIYDENYDDIVDLIYDSDY